MRGQLCKPCCVGPCTVMHQCSRAVDNDKRDGPWSQYLVNVTMGIKVALNKDEICLSVCLNPTPHHDADLTEHIPLNDTGICKSLSPTSVHLNSTVMVIEIKPGFVTKDDSVPLQPQPSKVKLCPVHTHPAMMLGKHRANIWPP